MKYLITGGAGFIGSHLSSRLIDLGHEVYSIDNFSDYYATSLKRARIRNLRTSKNYSFKRLDLARKQSFSRYLNRVNPDYVIHLAGQPGVRLSLSQLDKYARENLLGFHNCLTACLEQGTPNFLFASSSSVYGNDSKVPFSESELNLNPISYYGATKLTNELLARASSSFSDTKIRGLRFFTVYGPWGRPDMAYFRLINSAVNGIPFPKFGNGSVKRDFTFIDDTVESITKLSQELSEHEAGYFDIVNVGGGNPYSLNDLIEEIELQTDTKIMDQSFSAVNGDVNLTVADSQLLTALTSQRPSTSLSLGIEKTLKWARKPGMGEKIKKWADQ